MKKIFVLSVIILCSIIVTSEAEAYSLEILPRGSLDVTNNQSTVYFDIVLHVDQDIQLGNWGFDIIYDSSELSWYSTQTKSGLMPSPLVAGLFGFPFESVYGLIENFSAALSPPDAAYSTINNDLILATIVFNVIAGAADGNADVWFNKSIHTSFNINGISVPMSDMPVLTGSLDTDGDGIADDGDLSGVTGDNKCTAGNTTNCDDNCCLTPNSGQQDTDGDGYGNMCDADLDNNGNVGVSDFNIFKSAWFSNVSNSNWNPAADFDSYNNIGVSDFNILKTRWFTNAPWH